VPDRRAGFDQGPDRRSGRRRSHRLVHECLAASSRPTRARLPPSAPPPRARRAGRSWSRACCSRRSSGAKRSPPSHRPRRRCPPVHRPAHRAIDRRTELESRAVLDASAASAGAGRPSCTRTVRLPDHPAEVPRHRPAHRRHDRVQSGDRARTAQDRGVRPHDHPAPVPDPPPAGPPRPPRPSARVHLPSRGTALAQQLRAPGATPAPVLDDQAVWWSTSRRGHLLLPCSARPDRGNSR